MLKIIKPGQVLCDMFCGVGPLAIKAGKAGIKVLANDLNPDCYKYCLENVTLNKLKEGMVRCYNMCARKFVRDVVGDATLPKDVKKIDHYYMNLPVDAVEFLDAFIGLYAD